MTIRRNHYERDARRKLSLSLLLVADLDGGNAGGRRRKSTRIRFLAILNFCSSC